MSFINKTKKLAFILSWAGLSICLSLAASRAADAAGVADKKLVIVKAVYGDLPNGASTDVTDKVVAMLKDNQLTVEATNDNFGDPAEGVWKQLKVDYTLDGAAKSKSAGENQTLKLSGKPPKLVITKAVYGDLTAEAAAGSSTDVTEKVADKVDMDALSIDVSNENFGDPANGVTKKLKVDYTLNGVAGTKTVEEYQVMRLSANPPRLVIKKAVYGDLTPGAAPATVADVTKKVAEKVDVDTLSIDATNDNFTDPANGVGKKLTVDYTFDGAEKSKTVDENQTLTISDKGE
jgi:hypothetical protein